jgi:hypothetical protein
MVAQLYPQGIRFPFRSLLRHTEIRWSYSNTPHIQGSFTLYPEESAPNIHLREGWVGPRADKDAVEKRKISCLCQESNLNSSAVQPVARRNTELK